MVAHHAFYKVALVSGGYLFKDGGHLADCVARLDEAEGGFERGVGAREHIGLAPGYHRACLFKGYDCEALDCDETVDVDA